MGNFFKDNPFVCFVSINNFTGAYSLLSNKLITDTDSVEIGFKCKNVIYVERTNYFKNSNSILVNFCSIFMLGDYFMREQQKRINDINYDCSEVSMLKLIETYATTPIPNNALDMKTLFEITDKYYKNEI